MAAPNVWTQMGYVPPRGQCNYSKSVISARCPCLRFMLHPLKSTSSYDCDGCGHHASFHSMENKMDDETRKRWEQEAKERAAREEEEVQQRPKKRTRAIEYDLSPLGLLGMGFPSASGNSSNIKNHAGASKKTNRTRGVIARDQRSETVEEGSDKVIEVD